MIKQKEKEDWMDSAAGGQLRAAEQNVTESRDDTAAGGNDRSSAGSGMEREIAVMQSADPTVRFTDRVAEKGGVYGIDAGSIGFSNGTPTLGGQPVNAEYIDSSGKAWTKQSEADAAVDRYIRQTGLKSPLELYEQEWRRARSDLQRQADSLKNYRPFEYDPAEDKVFQSYLQQYRLEGSRAAEDQAATLSALTGGYTNSAAVTAAAQAQNYYAQKGMAALPEFAQQAYERYLDEYDRAVQAYDRDLALASENYGYALEANDALLDNLRYTAASNAERDRYYAEQMQENANADLERRLLEQELAQGELDYLTGQANYRMALTEAEYYPTLLQYQAQQEYQKLMQGDVEYQQGLAELESKRIDAEYAARLYEEELRYQQSRTDKNYR